MLEAKPAQLRRLLLMVDEIAEIVIRYDGINVAS